MGLSAYADVLNPGREKMLKPKCPKCESTAFETISVEDYHLSFVCCSACGTIVAYRDSLMIDKLDMIAEALEFNK